MSAQMCIYVTNSAELYKNNTENLKVHICQDFFFWFSGVIYKNVGKIVEVCLTYKELVGVTKLNHDLDDTVSVFDLKQLPRDSQL